MACVDDPFPTGYSCGHELQCVRQNQFYWQCLEPSVIPDLGPGWTITRPQPTHECPAVLPGVRACSS